MDALKGLDPQTKVSDLTVEQFEAVMTRSLCRVVEFAAVRFSLENDIREKAKRTTLHGKFEQNRLDGARDVHEAIQGGDWPEFFLPDTPSPPSSS